MSRGPATWTPGTPVHIADPLASREFIAERRRRGSDRLDEVWDEVYMAQPLADLEHQDVIGEYTTALKTLLPDDVRIFGGCNVSDRPDDWTKNYRCPDVVVYLDNNPVEDRGSHWFGGPDLAMEIVSPGDRSRDNIDFYFYAAAGTRELFVLDRDPWRLELYRVTDGAMRSVSKLQPDDSPITTETLPLAWSLVTEGGRPWVRVAAV